MWQDSNRQKLGGGIVNALIFIGAIASLTFVLFLLFKYRCMKVIYGYMAFSGFTIYAYFGGAVLAQVSSFWSFEARERIHNFILSRFFWCRYASRLTSPWTMCLL